MPSFKTIGKSKEDLAVIAQLSGLLTAEETAGMTRTELAKMLEQESRKSEQTGKIAAAPAKKKKPAGPQTLAGPQTPAAPAKRTSAAGKPKKAVFQISLAAADKLPSPEVKPKRIARSRIKHGPVEEIALPALAQVTLPAAAPDPIPAATPAPDPIPAATPAPDPIPAATPAPEPALVTIPEIMAVTVSEPVLELIPEQTAARAKRAVRKPAADIPVKPFRRIARKSAEPIPEKKSSLIEAPVDPVGGNIVRSRTGRKPRKADSVQIAPSKAAVRETARQPLSPATDSAEQLTDRLTKTRTRIRKAAAEAVMPDASGVTTPVPASVTAPAIIETSPSVISVPQSESPEAVILPVRRTAGRRKKTERAPEVAAAAPQSSIAIGAQPSTAVEAPPAARADLLPPAVIPEPSPERSPEAAEAAADQVLSGEKSEMHRVLPHHTLKPVQTNRRRNTRLIGDPTVGGSQESAQVNDQPAQFQDDPLHYPSALDQQPAMLSDQQPGASGAMPAETSESGQQETIVPINQESEGESARLYRPFIETGDLQAGVLEIMPDGYGFLRKENYLQGNKDIYVPPQYIRRFGLRPGDFISGPVKLQRENDRYQALLYIKDVNGMAPEKMLRRAHFDRLTPIYPNDRFILETVRNELSTRIIDLVAPIGKGQRGMIVSPPKAGKTILLQKIANAISTNNPEVKLIVLLIDERPEEVTDMQRSINGEVVYSTFDKTPENHTKVTELVLERAMRLVELKQDVIILLDSMTRLARAYNLTINPTGRTLSGGLDPGALYGPKRFFGAARNIENGGSLTIIATSLIETGSRMDEVIFEEFKGTGNMEVYLDRKMQEKRIFPAIDINKSGTRREELLMSNKELDAVWTIRKAFSQLDATSVAEAIINLLLKTKNNEHFISSVNVSFNDKNVFEAMRGVKPNETGSGPSQVQNTRNVSSTYSGGYNNSGYESKYRRQQTNDDD